MITQASRIAEILIPHDLDSKGRKNIVATIYGGKTREGVADLILREMGFGDDIHEQQATASRFGAASDMLAALQAALPLMECVSDEEFRVCNMIKDAITKATTPL